MNFPADFNHKRLAQLRATERNIRAYNSLRAMRVHMIPNDAPATLIPAGNCARNLIGIIAGARGFLPACTVQRMPGIQDLATFTLDGMPVIRQSRRKAYRAARVLFSRAHMAGMI